jgi:hypothetical protein
VDAIKMAGRLAYASFAAVGPIGRNRARSIHKWANRGGGSLASCSKLVADMSWWCGWLRAAQACTWVPRLLDLPSAVLYTDAEGSGGIGGVLVLDGVARWFGGVAPKSIVAKFKPRLTQIFPLEITAALAALLLWAPELRLRRVAVFIDNVAARAAANSGTSSQADASALLESLWRTISDYLVFPSFYWVPSALNCSDPPSRKEAAPVGVQQALRVDWSGTVAALVVAEGRGPRTV